MARTKQTARQAIGSKAPRKGLANKQNLSEANKAYFKHRVGPDGKNLQLES